ncbi:Gfo/Idh/MocA family protein [Tengunoibacter tsumagoiensis]|uniref:NADH-dependent dehydrogenase n=1 Tax=Tengunoibacter tsumagoiensis TaxID=2014871 RepID=A0A402A7Q9_9CHLR|nr:Gfo/Idh/MocA family oxidoreductase [Tengunoibacter tsumagoiensis]GCE15183.1 NADH-dependent dehydrogenase [Tengunoibacter tsumagoiensis]
MDLAQILLAAQPHVPAHYRPGIGIIGSGGIVRGAHLPAYQKYGLNVIGIYDIQPAATQAAQAQWSTLRIFETLDELLDNPDIEVVDIATHPAQRVELIQRALAAGKHVLSQKPFAPDLSTARMLVTEAEQRGLLLAVNQNGRWSPAWRVATLLLQQQAIGSLLAVTHLFETSFAWRPGSPFDLIPHSTTYDYAIHWIDIIRCWLEDYQLSNVRAQEYRTPNQPLESKSDWGMSAEFSYQHGVRAFIHCIGGTETSRQGHPFWLHGTQGTIRGCALGNDFIELERDGVFSRFDLKGSWFPDGFAGAMGELLSAIAEQREPYNSARHNLLTLEMTLAACQSEDADGQPVAFEEVPA